MKRSAEDQAFSRRRIVVVIGLAMLGGVSAPGLAGVGTTGNVLFVPSSPTSLIVGNTLDGSILIDGGSILDPSHPTLGGTNVTVGGSAGVLGAGQVTGSGSQWNANSMTLGINGTGSLTVDAGGSATMTGTLTAGFGVEGGTSAGKGNLTVSGGSVRAAALNVARNLGTDGKATVTGAGSTLTLRAAAGQQTFMNVGRLGSGQLDVLAGAKLVMDPTTTSTSLFNALNIAGPGGTTPGSGASSGTMNVSGAGSEVRLKSNFSNVGVGRNGAGAMNVTGGGQVIIENVTDTTFSSIGRVTGATGTVVVDGTSSLWQAGRRLFVASDVVAATLTEVTTGGGIGTLTVSNGGRVKVGDDVVIGAGGTLKGGGGTIEGNILNRGTIAPGNSPGVMNVLGNVVLTDSGTVSLALGGLAAGTGYGQLLVSGDVTFAGTLKLNSWGGFVGHGGDHFQLFGFAHASGHFASIDASGLALASGAFLDTSRLYVDGTLAVAAVPEPMPVALWTLGTAFVFWQGARRRRGNESRVQPG